MGAIGAIILAAGESKRMGFPKMLLPFHGTTMIENVIANVSASSVESTLIILGTEKDRLIEVIKKTTATYCYNDNYKEGMLSSVKCGFQNLSLDIKDVLVFQGDQPYITSYVINRVIEAYKSSGKGIVMPVYNGKRGHPLLIDRKYRNDIEKLDASDGLRSLAYMFSEDVLEVETECPGILRDFDTYEEYINEINQTE